MIGVDASVWVSAFVPTTHCISGAVGRQLGDPADAQEAVQWLLDLPQLHLVELDRWLSLFAARIAGDPRLRGADAVYVAVAAQFDIPLMSWDREQLERGAQRIVTRQPDGS